MTSNGTHTPHTTLKNPLWQKEKPRNFAGFFVLTEDRVDAWSPNFFG